MKHRSVGLIVLVAAMLAVLAAPAIVSAQSDALIIWADGTRAPLMQELGDDFEAEFGVPVEVQEMGLGDVRDQIMVAGPVGEGPDIGIIAHDHVGVLVANGAIVPLDLGDLADEFLPSALNLFTFNGELWGMPYGMENIALVRNTDLIPEAPATWEEVRAIAEQMPEGKYAFLEFSSDPYHNFPIISAFGGYIFGRNADGTFNVSDIGFSSPGGLAAGAWLQGMYQDGLMLPNVDNDVIFAMFEEGNLGMFVTGPWFSQRIVDTGIPYSIDPLPGAEGISEHGAPFSGGQGFVISAFSDKQLLAEQFLFDFVATDDTMQALFDADPRVPAWKNVDTSSDPNLQGFIAAGENSIPMPAIPEMAAVWSAAGNALTLVSQGAEAEPTFMDATTQILNAIEMSHAEERIVGVPGSYQAAAGCGGDWDPACELTLMEAQGDGIFTLTIDIPAGDYEFKVAMNGSWDENYGADGVAGGDNIPLSLSADSTVTFTYDDNTHLVTFEAAGS